jgi:hypothetical protein
MHLSLCQRQHWFHLMNYHLSLCQSQKLVKNFDLLQDFLKVFFLFTTKVLSGEIFLNWNRFIH